MTDQKIADLNNRINEIKEKLTPMEAQINKYFLEQDKLYDLINDAEKRLKEIKLVMHSQLAHGNSKKMYKSTGLIDESRQLKSELEVLTDIRTTL